MKTNQWQTASADLQISPDQLHVWSASLERTEWERVQFLQTLSADEKERAGRFYFDRDREHYVVGRGLLRYLLSRYLHIEPAEVCFAYGEHGKPKLADVMQAEKENRLAFNLSHSHGMALLAFGINRDIGVDIEPVRPLSDANQIAERFFSAREYRQFTAVSPAQQPQAFFNGWTRKEAYIKAIGDGLTCPLDAFDVTLTPGHPAQLLRIRGSVAEAAKWKLCSLEPRPEYVGAVIASGNDWNLKLWRWPDERSAN